MTERTAPKISRRNLVTAAAIVPAAAIRGSAANSAVTVGLIGCGGRGTHDAGLLVKEVPNARLVALADVFEDRVARAKKATGVQNVKEYPSGDALLAAGSVDAVIIATPVYLHPEHFEAAAPGEEAHLYRKTCRPRRGRCQAPYGGRRLGRPQPQ